MSDIEQEIIDSFIVEAQDCLSDISNDLIAIEENVEETDHDHVNKVFRNIHSIKGAAGFCGLNEICTVAHEMENVLNQIRNDELLANPKITELLLRGADLLVEMVDNTGQPTPGLDLESFKQAFQALEEEEQEEQALYPQLEGEESDVILEDGTIAFPFITNQEMIDQLNAGCHIYVIKVDIIKDLDHEDVLPAQFFKQITQETKLISSYVITAGIPTIQDASADSLVVRFLCGSSLLKHQIAEQLHVQETDIQMIYQSQGQVTETDAPEAAIATPPETTKSNEQPQTVIQAQPVQSQPQKKVEIPKIQKQKIQKPKAAEKTSPAPSNIRVDVNVLDQLMTLAGELVLSRNQLIEAIDNTQDANLQALSAKIDRITSEMQESVVQTRMQPIGSVFTKFPRIIRDLSNTLKKKCNLTIEGKEVDLDKSIIEAIGDPLTHLIRNAIDHGVEKPQDRIAKGKSETGNIELKAFHRAGKVNISITDDGAGLDVNVLRSKAIEKGIYTEEAAALLSDRELMRLIIEPGFSTAAKVTDISGRGVGMDVVATNIEKLGGNLDIQSELGYGTTFNIQLPLTLAIVPSLVVYQDHKKFAIPQTNIDELIRIRLDELDKKVQTVNGVEVLRLRGSLLPLVRLKKITDKVTSTNQYTTKLNTEFKHSEDAQDDDHNTLDSINIIILDAGGIQYGLVVEGLDDSQEIVVKPLGKHLTKSVCVSGATVLGDRTVALILDVSGISTQFNINENLHQELNQVDENKKVASIQDDTGFVLMFDNEPSERFAIPTGLISRIERVKASDINDVADEELLNYRGYSIKLISLEKHIKAKPRNDCQWLHVIVFESFGETLGIIAPTLSDIRHIKPDIDNKTVRENGVLGSLLIEGKFVRFLDIIALAKEHVSEDATCQSTPANFNKKDQTILLAEDSNFYRTQINSFLETEGFKTMVFNDGLDAWEYLQTNHQDIDLILTDIEMPNMDGNELSRNIKSTPDMSHLPIIAITSLSTSAAIQKSMASGVDEFLTKLDKKRLMESIVRILRGVQASKKALAAV